MKHTVLSTIRTKRIDVYTQYTVHNTKTDEMGNKRTKEIAVVRHKG